MPQPLQIAVRVDARPGSGVGHLVRQLALAEELVSRGHGVRFFGRAEVPWAAEQARQRGLDLHPVADDPWAFADARAADGTDVAVLDGYDLGVEWGAALRRARVGVATLCDGPFGLDQAADLYVDQNLGAVVPAGRHPDAVFLAGLDYAVLRDSVRAQRGAMTERWTRPAAVPRVLVVFGGSDPFGGCVRYVELLLETGRGVEIVAIAARRDVADAVLGLPAASGQRVGVHPPVDDLAALAVTCDAAVSAAGTSVWEFACLGVPTALVCVTENQVLGYREATRELCLPGGILTEVERGEGRADARRVLTTLLTDAALRETLGRRGMAAVDGRGRERVADAIEELARRER